MDALAQRSQNLPPPLPTATVEPNIKLIIIGYQKKEQERD